MAKPRPAANEAVDRRTLGKRLSGWFLKPVDPNAAPAPVAKRRSLDELEDTSRYADDRERLIGLIAAPFAALIAFLTVDATISHGRKVNAHFDSASYVEVLVVLLVLSLAMLATAWYRKRMYLGVIAAIYGITVFDLRYWGFGIPFVMVGAWLFVRGFRIQRDLKQATAAAERSARRGRGGSAASASRALNARSSRAGTSRRRNS